MLFPARLLEVGGEWLDVARLAKERCLIVLCFNAVDDLGLALLRHLVEFAADGSDPSQKREVRKILIQTDVHFLVVVGGEARRVARIKKTVAGPFWVVHDADLTLAHSFPVPTTQHAPVMYEICEGLRVGDFQLSGDKMPHALTQLQLHLMRERVEVEELAFRALNWSNKLWANALAAEEKKDEGLDAEAGNVPAGVVYQVFELMDPRERKNARLVCKSWHSALLRLLRTDLSALVRAVDGALPRSPHGPNGSRSTYVVGPSRELVVTSSYRQLQGATRALVCFLYVSGGSDGICADAAALLWQARVGLLETLGCDSADASNSVMLELVRFPEHKERPVSPRGSSGALMARVNAASQHLVAAKALLNSPGFFAVLRSQLVGMEPVLARQAEESMTRHCCLLMATLQYLAAIACYQGGHSEASRYSCSMLELDPTNTCALILRAHSNVSARKSNDAAADLKKVKELLGGEGKCVPEKAAAPRWPVLTLNSPRHCPCTLQSKPCPFFNLLHYQAYLHEPPPGVRGAWEQGGAAAVQQQLSSQVDKKRNSRSAASAALARRIRPPLPAPGRLPRGPPLAIGRLPPKDSIQSSA